MKKLIASAFAVLFLFGVLSAQDATTHDPQAKKILDKVSANTKAYKDLSIVFKYTIENKQQDISETHDGFAFMQGLKYKIIIPGNEIISDGKTIWSVQSEAEEVTISAPSESDDDFFNPAKLFTIYEKGFKYKYLGEAGSDYVIDLFPEKANEKNFSRVRLNVDKVKSQITAIKTFRKDGYVFSIVVSDYKPNTNLPAEFFNFNKANYSGFELIDMR